MCGTRPGQLGCQHHHRGIECIDIRHVWYRGEQCRDIPYCVCGTRPGQLGCQHHHRGIECIDIVYVWYRGEQCRDIPYCVCGIGVNNAGTYPTVCVELDLASLAVNTIIEV